MHLRLKRIWGPARNYPCVDCGKSAQEWAYDGTDPGQQLGLYSSGRVSKVWYSIWPEFYMPLCKKCHAGRDGAKAVAELLEYREWKFATRMTIADIALIKVGVPVG